MSDFYKPPGYEHPTNPEEAAPIKGVSCDKMARVDGDFFTPEFCKKTMLNVGKMPLHWNFLLVFFVVLILYLLLKKK